METAEEVVVVPAAEVGVVAVLVGVVWVVWGLSVSE
jgi:hypothetical protein